jgi:hypothetical protein
MRFLCEQGVVNCLVNVVCRWVSLGVVDFAGFWDLFSGGLGSLRSPWEMRVLSFARKWQAKATTKTKTTAKTNTGILRFAQNDDIKQLQ